MMRRSLIALPLLALSLGGCVDRGDWKPAPRLEPQALTAAQTLKDIKVDAAAWPADQWWRAYGDPRLDALVDEALAGSPSLAIAQARLRAAQAQTASARGARAPQLLVDATLSRERYPQNYLYPPPLGGSWSTESRAALDFSWDLDFWGRNRQLIAASRSAEVAAEADRQAARLAISVAVVQAYIQFDLNYALLDVTADNLKQQQSILDLTQQRVSAGLENTARVKQSEGTLALTRAALAFVEANIELSRNQLADLVGAGPDRGQSLPRPQLSAPADITLPSSLPARPPRAPPGRVRGARAGRVGRPRHQGGRGRLLPQHQPDRVRRLPGDRPQPAV